ncbi:MAG: RdgB/HAM1 family non-canonical purine NTP pyrophosphatase [Candidatus Adiutrix sp.]|jgi:XTP/dITP diphosphohydrolase|nr:RdgB/HAM1 family non-canonical purine NTP pyrophosphatase [Candidatus Adiutrix sp.]
MTPALLIATKNRPKAEELAALAGAAGGLLATLALTEWEAAHHRLAEPEEGADSFEANARAKARFYARATGLPALADDSGLSVEALGGAPGVLSARYGGPELDDRGRSELILANLAGSEDRRAFFTSVLALARPDGRSLLWTGRLDGLIADEISGAGGFGYDPIFFHPESGCTLAQLTASQKNQISHRARSAQAFLADLSRIRDFLAP